MPRVKALSYWAARCRKLADIENDLHIADAELIESLDEVYGDLHAIVADGAGAYWQRTESITADGSESYDEPEDHLSTICVEYVDNAGRRTPLKQLLAQERHLYGGLTGEAEAYALVDDLIYLYPTPSSGTYEMLYIPQAPDLTELAEDDLVDVVNIYGAHFLVYGTAALCLSKSESDERSMLARQARAEKKLIEWAANRSFHEPQRRYTEDDGWGYEIPTRRLPPP